MGKAFGGINTIIFLPFPSVLCYNTLNLILETFMKTLMHICCAPCANQPIEVLRTDGIEVAGF